MANQRRPRVALIGCGGTISSLAVHEFDYIDYPETGRKLTAGEVLERIPALAERADIIPIPFREVGSSAIGQTIGSDWRIRSRRLRLKIRSSAVSSCFTAPQRSKKPPIS